MDICPHCGSPGSFADASDGRCPVCGMALSTVSGISEKASDAPAEPVGASTLQPSSVSSGEIPTVDFDSNPPEEDTATPRGIDLIKPRELSPEYARRVTAAWQGTRSQFIDPKETIKSEKPGHFDTGGLNIGTRVVAEEDDSPEVKDYRLNRIIGQGAMGTVWSAWQSSLNREVALKMPRGSAKTEAGRKQFMSEVVVTGQLDHPNIVPIYDLAKDSSGELFYSMKKVEGRPWNELLQNEELSLQENLEILMKVCDAIRFAHDRGVIHRDIKPHNIMIGKYGEVSVMDWGIALRIDEESRLSSITRISPAGTPAYMAPEMATGHAGAIGPHTDVYLLGAVLYEILTREPPHPPPFDSKNYNEILNDALLIAARNEIPPIKTGGELADIAYKALATDVENRYQSVQDFQDAVREFHSHAESINLTERGEKLLARARTNGRATHGDADRFDDFDRARFAFEEALAIWPGNRTARKLQSEAILAYANYAYEEGAYARGIALLSEDKPEHKDLLTKLKKARRRTNSLSYMLKAAVLLIIVGGTAFSIAVYQLYREAQRQELIAKANAAEATKQAGIAKDNEKKAIESAAEAKRQEGIAKDNEKKAMESAAEAQRQEGIAKDNEKKAMESAAEAKRQEGIAKDNEVKVQIASYASEIGLAAQELKRNSFTRVEAILKEQAANPVKKALRNWEWGHLEALVNLDVQSFDEGKPLRERIESVAISNDQKWIVAGTNEGDLYVWRANRNQQPVKLEYGVSVNAVAITADGSMVLAAGRQESGQHAVKAWTLSATNGAAPIEGDFTRHDAPIISLDLSSDSSKLLVGTADGKIIVSNLDGTNQSKPLSATTDDTKSIWSARFSNDGQWIVTASDDGTVRVRSAETLREVQRFAHGAAVYAAAFAPSGEYLVSGGGDGSLKAWKFDAQSAASTPYSAVEPVRESLESPTDDLQQSEVIPLGEHDADVRSISFSTDGHYLFTAGHDHTICVWNMAEGLKHHDQPLKTLRGHGGWVRSCVALAGDSSSVLSAGYDHRVQIWNWEKYSFPRVLSDESRRSLGDRPLTAGAATPDGQWVATGALTGLITVWDLQNPLQPKSAELAEGHDWQATTAIYFDEGRRLLTAGGDNAALVWDELRGNELVRLGGWYEKVGSGWRGVAAVSSDGKVIATGAHGDILARIWDAQSGDLIKEIKASDASQSSQEEKREATALAFAPDGKTLLIGDQWGVCFIARADNNWEGNAFQAHYGKISGIEFLPDGQGLLTSGYDGTVQKWDLSTNEPKLLATFEHQDAIVAMDMDNSGRFFITAVVTPAGANDAAIVIRIWDPERSQSPTHSLSLSDIGGRRGAAKGEQLMVRSVSLHPSEPRALVTIFDPLDSRQPYSVGSWEWTRPNGNSPFQLISGLKRRDLSTAVFAPHRGEAILTVGGRGAQLRSIKTNTVAMIYRPQTAIHSLSFSSDGKRLISSSADGTLKIWALDSETRQWKPENRLIEGHTAAINRVVFHPTDNDSFLTASNDGTALIWQHRNDSWEPVRRLNQPKGQEAWDATFVGAQAAVATVGPGGAFVWGPGDAPRRVEGIDSAQGVTSSPDGKWLIIASGPMARLVDAATLRVMPATLAAHSADITAAAFTSDGSRLFTTSEDYTVKLWDARAMVSASNGLSQQRELLTLEEHEGPVTSVTAVSGTNAPLVVTTSLDGQAIVWPNEPVE